MQVLTFGGELLGNAEDLIRSGLHPVEIADGYAKAGAKVQCAFDRASGFSVFLRRCVGIFNCSAQALEFLDTLVVPGSEVLDVRSKDAVRNKRLLSLLTVKGAA